MVLVGEAADAAAVAPAEAMEDHSNQYCLSQLSPASRWLSMSTARYSTASSQLCVRTAKETDDSTSKIETPEPAVAPYISCLKSATHRPARFVPYSNARHEKYFFLYCIHIT